MDKVKIKAIQLTLGAHFFVLVIWLVVIIVSEIIFRTDVDARVEPIEQKIEALSTEDIEAALASAQAELQQRTEELTELSARVNLLLEATSDQNVQTALLAFQRVNDLSNDVKDTSARLNALDNRLWVITTTVVLGIIGFFAKEFFMRKPARGEAPQGS